MRIIKEVSKSNIEFEADFEEQLDANIAYQFIHPLHFLVTVLVLCVPEFSTALF